MKNGDSFERKFVPDKVNQQVYYILVDRFFEVMANVSEEVLSTYFSGNRDQLKMLFRQKGFYLGLTPTTNLESLLLFLLELCITRGTYKLKCVVV